MLNGMFDFKSLIGTLLSNAPSRSNTAQSATQLLRELPETDYFDALAEITKAIARINADTQIPLKERIRTLLYVDARAYPLHCRLCREYLADESRNKIQLPTILAYLHELANAYQICLRLYLAAPTVHLEDRIQQAVLHGLYHQLRLVFWNAQRYVKTEGMVWQQAYRFYAFLEECGIARLPLRLYQGDIEAVSAEQLLLNASMLTLAYPDNMQSVEIQAVDHLLRLLVTSLTLSRQPALDEPVYALNLDTPDAPHLWHHGTASKEGRYWSAQPLSAALADIMFSLDQDLPPALADIGLGLTAEAWRQLADKLGVRWSHDGGASLRKAVRELRSEDIAVTIGFTPSALLVKLQDTGYHNHPERGLWKLTDSSSSGMGLLYLGRALERLRIGFVVVVLQNDRPAVLAVVRRLQRQPEGGTRVGIETLGHSPLGVTLCSVDRTADPVGALYITQPNSHTGQHWLLLPESHAVEGRTLILLAQDETYQIRLHAPSRRFGDCVHCEFDTLSRLDPAAG